MGRADIARGGVLLTHSYPPTTTTRPSPSKAKGGERSSAAAEEKRSEMGRKAKVEFVDSPPDDFDPKNPYADPVAMLEYREHLVREKWIQIETAKIIRERLRWCYRVEGINHHVKCRHLVDQYLESTRGVGWGKDHRPAYLHGTAPIPILLFLTL
jgi:NADH dehydrogenase (ubiquinone) 1 beta subcomplex subunit 10